MALGHHVHPDRRSGFTHLATVIDLFSGRHRAELVGDVLAAAVAARGGNVAGMIFRSDRGSQCKSRLAADYWTGQSTRRTMGRVGSCFDNVAAEAEGRRETFRSYEQQRHRQAQHPDSPATLISIAEWKSTSMDRGRLRRLRYLDVGHPQPLIRPNG
jgi:transposase InsO family protein